jgi:hypothetical protein
VLWLSGSYRALRDTWYFIFTLQGHAAGLHHTAPGT